MTRWVRQLVITLAGAAVLVGLDVRETCSGSEKKMSLEKKSLGVAADGKKVDEYRLTNVHGLVVKVMTYGGIITSVETPDRQGKLTNITLSLDSLQDYLAGHPFFGAIAGRYANRIAKGQFTLDGKQYTLATNNGPNHLHGGIKGFDKAVWKAEEVPGKDFVGVKLTHFSPDGDEGYPGNLTATVLYSLNNNNELKMEYTATTDKATPVNLTNHTYWNLGGRAKGGILDELMMINADHYLPVDDTLIPIGKPAAVKGTPMDFTRPTTIGADRAGSRRLRPRLCAQPEETRPVDLGRQGGRARKRPGDGDLYHAARDPVLYGQLPRRQAPLRRRELPGASCLLSGDRALSRLAQPAAVSLDDSPAGQNLSPGDGP